jgi:hypothetical protein
MKKDAKRYGEDAKLYEENWRQIANTDRFWQWESAEEYISILKMPVRR